jgi:hypothetical protein
MPHKQAGNFVVFGAVRNPVRIVADHTVLQAAHIGNFRGQGITQFGQTPFIMGFIPGRIAAGVILPGGIGPVMYVLGEVFAGHGPEA